jgi:outer membrane protein assembly factor BamB
MAAGRRPTWVRRTIGLVVGGSLLWGCAGDGYPSLDDALERQPAGLLDAADLDGSFVIDPTDKGCNGEREARLLRLRGTDGGEVWHQTAPAAATVVVVGDAVVTVGTDQADVPPSAAAADLATGEPRWQRFFESPSAELVGASDRAVVVYVRGPDHTIDDELLVALDPASGNVIWQAAAGDEGAYPIGMVDGHTVVLLEEQWWQAVAADGTVGPRVPAAARPILSGPLILQREGDDLVARGPTGVARWTIAHPFDATFTSIGQVTGTTDATTLIELDSHLGPDHRLLVVDSRTGQVRWQDDGVAASHVAGDVVLIDVRTDADPNDPSRRTAVARSVTDGTERWRIPNASMAGFLSRVGDEAILSAGVAPQPDVHRDFAVADLLTGEGMPSVAGSPLESDVGRIDFAALGSSHLFVVVDAEGSGEPVTIAAFDGTTNLWEERQEQRVADLVTVEGDVVLLTSDPSYSCE